VSRSDDAGVRRPADARSYGKIKATKAQRPLTSVHVCDGRWGRVASGTMALSVLPCHLDNTCHSVSGMACVFMYRVVVADRGMDGGWSAGGSSPHWFLVNQAGKSISSGWCKFGRVYLHIHVHIHLAKFTRSQFFSGTCKLGRVYSNGYIFKRLYFQRLYFIQMTHRIRNFDEHDQLKLDLIDHVWQKFGNE
jgi:hypothetical protein